ncbi:MAG: sugar phosphate isomerase/epimerase, partial [Victivallales bacterium]|nr:sugar phosphate isomerase/epimerase [Victivallales bacterium]
DIGEDNLGLNFDPANLLIYGSDEPAHVVEEMGDLVKVIHCKDARHAADGDNRGQETPIGKGDTNFANLLKSLLARGFGGPLIIERELPLGPEQEKDVAEAVIFIQNIIKGA